MRLRVLILFVWLEVDLFLKFFYMFYEYIMLFNVFFVEKMWDNFMGNGNWCIWLCFFLLWKIEGKCYFCNRIKIKIKVGYFWFIVEDNFLFSRIFIEYRCNISLWNVILILYILFVCLLICIVFFYWFIWFNFSFFLWFCV